MKPNVGTTDRALRIVLGVALLTLVFAIEGNARWLGLVGLIPLLTALRGWCPVYSVFGTTTR